MSAPGASHRAVAPICKLPNELFYHIIGYLTYACDINALGMTCREFRPIADHVLYPRYAKQCTPAGMSRMAREGNAKSVRKLFASGVNLKRFPETTYHYRSPMCEAGENGRLEVFQAFVDVLGRKEALSLLEMHEIVVRRGHLDIIDCLIRMGLSNEAALRMVIIACKDCPLSTVEFLVNSFWIDFNASHDEDMTPVRTAILAGRLDVIKCLLNAGATIADSDLKGPYRCGSTLLRTAESNHTEVVRFLLERGLKAEGFTLLQLQEMVRGGADDCAVLLFDHMRQSKRLKRPELLSTENRTALLVLAAAIGDEALFGRLLCNVCINKKPDGWILNMSSPGLYVAIERGRDGMVKAILDKLKDEMSVGLADEYRKAVSYAISAGQTSTIAMILDHASSAWVDLYGYSWLDGAAKVGDPSTFLLLQERGGLNEFADLPARPALQRHAARLGKALGTNWKGTVTELEQVLHLNESHLARELCHQFRTGIIGALATHWDADSFNQIFDRIPDFKGAACYKAFANAMDVLHFETVQVFLQRSVDPNSKLLTQAKNSAPSLTRCVHALFRVALPGHPKVEECLKIMRKLVDSGADVDALDSANRTALCYAIGMKENNPWVIAIAKELLDLGADPLVRLDLGQSPLQSALESGIPEMVELCMKALWDRGTLHIKWSALEKIIPFPCEEHDDWEAYENEAATGYSVDDKMRTWRRFAVKKTLYKYKWRVAYPPQAPWRWDDEI
jgi:ankyrin repeat protein